MEIWTKKYEPKSRGEIVGQAVAVKRIHSFIEGGKGALLLYGPTGTGKTSSVYAIARDLDCEVMEVNSSDVRNKEAISRIVGSSANQASLFMRKKVILVDEVDGVSGVHDRGGIAELVNIVRKSAWPMIFTCNDAYADKLKLLRKVAAPVEFSFLDSAEIFFMLKAICEKERVSCSDDILKALSWQSGGDMRSAINDLQNVSVVDNNVSSLDVLGGRMQRSRIEDVLRLIYKSNNPVDVLGKFDDTDLDLDDCLLWLDENLPREYSGLNLVNAYECLSRADVFRGRIRRWQHWRFLVYVNVLLTAGVAVSKDGKIPGAVDYRRSSRILMIWQANMRNAKRKSIAGKVASKVHCSSRRAFTDVVPYFKVIFEKGLGEGIAKELGLDEEELAWLKGNC